MRPTRRDLLIAGAAAGLALAGCKDLRQATGHNLPERMEPPEDPQSPGFRIANRLGFGPTPGQAEAISTNIEGYIREQLAASQPEPPHLQLRLQRLDIHQLDGFEMRDWPEDAVLRQLQQALILRAVYSPNQLRERMVDFWTNHFNVYGRKGWSAYRKAEDERKVIRANALGSFPTMLRASAKSAAMLAYLDNQLNTRRAPNENYARELMELHALGIDGGYTQRDVEEVARCLTGWTIERRFMSGFRPDQGITPFGRLRFVPEWHDDGEKRVLGRRIPAGGGQNDIDLVLDILIAHPSCARFITGKLCRYFLGEGAPSAYRQAEKAFVASRGDIRATMQVISSPHELLGGHPVVKRPFDFVVSALRAFAFDTDGGTGVQGHLERMGQPLYQWPMPDGYPDQSNAWTGSLLARWNFAIALAHGQVDGCRMPQQSVLELDSKAGSLVGSQVAARDVSESIALALCAPEFQWK
ncbi:MAG: hypothetical protein HONBIEJF_01569 [Fimbriimonadaceae bacterium]|nr:hypothetical protein [Fimbriimonadaceae bacterium]